MNQNTIEKQRKERWTNPDTGKIVKHPYEKSFFSGAGNCWCGRWDTHPLHLEVVSESG